MSKSKSRRSTKRSSPNQVRVRHAGPVEGYRMAPGRLGVTLDVEGCDPSTFAFDITKVADLLAAYDRLPGRPAYYPLVRGLMEEFVESRLLDDPTRLQAVGFGVLWSIFNHPTLGGQMRAAVSSEMRKKGKAHVTWHFSQQAGLGMALSDRFVDFGAITRSGRPEGLIFARRIDNEEKPN